MGNIHEKTFFSDYHNYRINCSLPKSDHGALKQLQEKSHISSLIGQRFLQERAAACTRMVPYNQDTKKQVSIGGRIFENPSCKIHDMEISAEQEECDGEGLLSLKPRSLAQWMILKVQMLAKPFARRVYIDKYEMTIVTTFTA